MKIFIKKVAGIEIPKQGTPDSVGFDLVANQEPIIEGEFVDFPMDNLKLYKSISYIQYHTGVFISPQEEKKGKSTNQYFSIITPRSSISKKNLMLKNGIGTLDRDYTGEIIVRMQYVAQPEDLFQIPEGGWTRTYIRINWDKIYIKGNSIAQLIILPQIPVEWELVDKLPETKRSSGGFGSTDK